MCLALALGLVALRATGQAGYHHGAQTGPHLQPGIDYRWQATPSSAPGPPSSRELGAPPLTGDGFVAASGWRVP